MLYRFYRPVNAFSEICFYVETDSKLGEQERQILCWLLSETFEPGVQETTSFSRACEADIVEVGPRLNFATPFSSNAVSICHACSIPQVTRLERSIRSTTVWQHDRMTETIYREPLQTLTSNAKPEPVFTVPILKEGAEALRRINRKMGLGMDEQDIAFYCDLFLAIRRDPTNVECFQLGQANSEHCRHWVFRGNIVIDGKEMPQTLFEAVKSTLRYADNSLIAFHDNSSAIRGNVGTYLVPLQPGKVSEFGVRRTRRNPIFTAETHNFPSGVAPFPGAETGTGGRIRDIQATGRGGIVTAGTAGYCVGGLQFPGYQIPGDELPIAYPANLASPLDILIQASNGASDYGNKFGEPVVGGFCRHFDQRVFGGTERRAWLKPIMFTGGVGFLDDEHVQKRRLDRGEFVIQIGGPAYRIGMGGGSASSMIQGQNAADLDFNAVQRGDAKMAQCVNRVIRTCVEMHESNPIISIHDQGAGGPCNVLTELVEPAGAQIEIRNINRGDASLSVLEIWGAEYQERNALLLHPVRLAEFQAICERENVPCEVLGMVSGTGRITLHDSNDDSFPVDLELSKILGDLPQKTFTDSRPLRVLTQFNIPEAPIAELLEDVFKLPSVGSKGFLVHKVDRSVTGQVAGQQCCGIKQLPIADVAIVASNALEENPSGAATAIGEQPVKMLVSQEAGARMAVAEAITNLAGAYIPGGLQHVKCSANEMWAAKLPGEMAGLYDSVTAACDFMKQVGVSIDGGKDSLSMAAKVGEEIVKAPGQIVISLYAAMTDVTKVVTPDIKHAGDSFLILIKASNKMRLGGSALAQSFGEIGDESPDVEDPEKLVQAFRAVQKLVKHNVITAYHDISDGGLITTVAEMIMAAECGCLLKVPQNVDPVTWLFSEEIGMVVECPTIDMGTLTAILQGFGVEHKVIGTTNNSCELTISQGCDNELFNEDTQWLRGHWERTSDELEALQMNPVCALEQMQSRELPIERTLYRYTSFPLLRPPTYDFPTSDLRPNVLILRAEGSNGDREMAAAFRLGGFAVFDAIMSDLEKARPDFLDQFQGIAFVGGFAYADALDSAKGWAGMIRFNSKLRKMFDDFYNREDTFSLGVCNGCQLMALLGWIPFPDLHDSCQPRFIRNISRRFESRWSTVMINPNPAIMLQGMEGSILGVPVAHGEGRLHFPDKELLGKVTEQQLAPMTFVDSVGQPTEAYPFNPNGSPQGLTALCSTNGRHLAMMPHPERAFWLWQWHYAPQQWKRTMGPSPWIRMFQNAYEWCLKTRYTT